MNYELPSGIASIQSSGGIMPTVEYRYPQSRKEIERALKEALGQLILMEQFLKCAEECGYSR